MDAFQREEMEHYRTQTDFNPDKTAVERLYRESQSKKWKFPSVQSLYGKDHEGKSCVICSAPNVHMVVIQSRCMDEPSCVIYTCRVNSEHTWKTN